MPPSTDKKVIVITAPSGSGKTSITRHLLKTFPGQLGFSVSATTRPPRAYEKDKKDYYFITEEDFKYNIQHENFVEWEMVYEGKYYGTLKSELYRIWKENKVPLLDIDVKGAIHVMQQYPTSCLSIFIEPPSLEELKRRLQSRGTETEESLLARLNKASYEISFQDHFHKIIVNDTLDHACKETEEIVRSFLQD